MSDDDESVRTLYCGNLSDRVTEELLYELLLYAGPIDDVRIPKDPMGKQRSYGFTIFKHKEAVPYAISIMEGVSLYGRQLKLQYRNNDYGGISPMPLPPLRHFGHQRHSHSGFMSPQSPHMPMGFGCQSMGSPGSPFNADIPMSPNNVWGFSHMHHGNVDDMQPSSGRSHDRGGPFRGRDYRDQDRDYGRRNRKRKSER